MMMLADKKRMMDSIVESVVGGKEEYSTTPKEMGESAKLCALEFIKAVEMKDPARLIAAFQALSIELESEEDNGETEIEIKL